MPTPLPSHVQWLHAHRGPQLLAVLEAQGCKLGIEDALGVLMSADPSPGLRGVQWLCDTLLAGGYRWEDVAGGAKSKAAETLGWFSQYRSGLPRSQRNLASYPSLASLYRAIQPLLPKPEEPADPGGRQRRRTARAQAYKDSIVLCARPDLIVAVPMNRVASQWWGRGTRWCTAADEGNMFEDYHEDSPLIVVVLPGVALQAPGVALQAPGVALQSKSIADLQSTGIAGGKLQMCIDADGDMQFMDAADDEVDGRFVEQNWSRLGGLIMWAFERCADALQYIPDLLRTREVWLSALRRDGDLLEIVPPAMVDKQMCRIAVEQSAFAIRYVPQELLDAEMCRIAVQSDGAVLGRVPAHMHSHKLYVMAARSNGSALEYIPDEAKTYRMCLDAIHSNAYCLENVPQQFRTRELYQAMVGAEPELLRRVPRERVGAKLYAKAIDADGMQLCNVRSKYLTRKLCLAAVTNNGRALRHVPHEFRDKQMCWTAIHNHRIEPHSFSTTPLQEVPEGLRRRKLCTLAVSRDGRALEYVPQALRTGAMCTLAVQDNRAAIAFVPRSIMTEEFAMMAVRTDAMCMIHLPHSIRTGKVNAELLAHWPSKLSYVDQDFLDVDMCVAALVADPDVWDSVPLDLEDDVRQRLPSPGPSKHNWQPEAALAGLAEALAAPVLLPALATDYGDAMPSMTL